MSLHRYATLKKKQLFYFGLRRVCVVVYGLSCELLFATVLGLVIAVASLVAESVGSRVRGLQQLWHMASGVSPPRLQSTCSVVVAHRLSCFLEQGSN